MKKTILTLCVLLAFALIFTGCGGNDAGGNPAGNGGTPTNGTGSGGNGGTPDGGNPAGGSDSLDGDWVGGMKLAEYVSLDDFDNQALYNAFLASPIASRTIPIVKLTISGNSYTALPAIDGYTNAAYLAIMTDSTEPEPEWDTRPENSDSGTVTVSGNTITITSSIQGGGTGTLASDKQSFTLTFGVGEPKTFVKQ